MVLLVDKGYDHDLAWPKPYRLICNSITQARVQICASVTQKKENLRHLLIDNKIKK